jgi:predicted DNA-binding transcriptional regulator AlpA
MKETGEHPMSELLTKPEAAKFLRLSLSTLERLTKEKCGPRRVFLSPRRIVYQPSDLREWANACRDAGEPSKAMESADV